MFPLFLLIHLALRSSAFLHEFQQNTSQYAGIRVVVTGKRVNRGIGLGQEIPVDYFFHIMETIELSNGLKNP